MSSVLGLKARPQTRERLAARGSPKCLTAFCTRSLLLALVGALDRAGRISNSRPCSRAVATSALHVLGEAAAAVADAGEEERVADALVGAHAPCAPASTSAPTRSQSAAIVVHEGDARGEHGVGGVLGQLGRARVHEEDRVARCARTARRARAMICAGPLALDADDHAVGLDEVVDRRALLEELGVGDDVELGCAVRLADRLAHLVGGAHRHGALVHDDACSRVRARPIASAAAST